MTIFILFVITTIIFLGIDVIGINQIIRPVFEAEAGHLLAENFKLAPAAVFYLFYVGGLLWFVSAPAMREGTSLSMVFLGGAILGALAYGTFEFTSLAVLRDWTWKMVIVDTTWGAVLTGASATAGVALTRLFTA